MEQKDIGGGGCRIPTFKIKIPKRAHYCKECGKSFNSGKVLGGHMSSTHVQAASCSSKKVVCKKKSAAGSSPTCMLCGKVFHSQKSLFGHMRCHPEREWRGMEPPRRCQLGFLNGWPTSKRGRPPLSSNSGHTKDAFVAGLELIKMLKDDHQTKRNDDDLYVTAIQVLVSGKREREDKDCARVSVTNSHSASTSDATTAFAFDLNLLPAEEEEDSYNS